MTPEELQSLRSLPQFPRTAEELIHVAGLEAAARIISAWPGQEFPVPAVVGGGNLRGVRRYDQLAEIVGEPAARRIVAHWHGQRLSVPNCKEVKWSRDQDRIRTEFDRLTGAQGYSFAEAVFELGLAFNVTGRCVEQVLGRPDNAPPAPVDQGSLF